MRRFYLLVVSRKLFIVGSFGTVLSSSFFQVKTHITSKGKLDKLEILILQFKFFILILKFCNTILHTQIILNLFSILIFSYYESLVISRIGIKQTLIFYFNADFTVWNIWRGCFENPAFSIRIVDSWGEALF